MPTLEALIPSFVIIILSLSFHEAAHAWAADRLGDPTARQLGRLTLNPLAHIDWIGTVLFPLIAMYSGAPLLGWAKPVPVNWNYLKSPRRDFALVALAGPLSNLVLALAGALLLKVLPGGETAMARELTVPGFVVSFVVTNVMLAVFNLFPVPPLDGGNVLSGFVPESVARMIDRLRPYGFLILYALLLTGVLYTIMDPIVYAVARWLLL